MVTGCAGCRRGALRAHGWWLPQYRLKTFFYDNGTPFAPRICHGKFAVTDARRGAEREPPRALLRTVRRHPWFGTVHGGPCPRDTRRALARRPCWDSHHGRRSAGAAFGTLRSGHAVPQSARSSAPFDPGVVSILPFGRLGCSNRRGTVPDSSMMVLKFASNLARSATSPQIMQGSRATQGRRMAPTRACPDGSDTPAWRMDR
jgi:hypothetical protein